jgi:propionate catabolism operon transcriptional regulator
MRIKTLVIAPYRGLVELTTSLAKEFPEFDVTVIEADLSEVVPNIKSFEEEGYDMIISRGGTARLIRKHSTIPVIEIQVSGYDIIRMLTLIKEYKMQIEMIGFPNIINGVVSIARLMNIEIQYTVIENEGEVSRVLEQAKAKGALVIVGDTITVKLAKEHGLEGVLITSGRESVMEAFEKAKQIHQIIRPQQVETSAYKEVLDRFEIGIGLVELNGAIKFANAHLRQLLMMPAEDTKKVSLFDKLPILSAVTHEIHRTMLDNFTVTIHQFNQKMKVSCELLPSDVDNKLFLFKLSSAGDENESEISIIYLEQFINSFPQLITTNKAFHNDIVKAEEALAKGQPLVIYGEEGVGKRLFVGALQSTKGKKPEKLIEIEINQPSEAAFEQFKAILLDADDETTFLTKGIEKINAGLQKKLSDLLPEIQARLIFSFEEAPIILRKQNLLTGHLFEKLGDYTVCLAPLKDRKQNLNEYFRFFIAQFNEKYGKQVVGIHPDVMEELYSHPWKGNLIELRDLLEHYMKNVNGEYVEKDILPLLSQMDGKIRQGSEVGKRKVNLNQPLDKIERDIVQMVLEEENMNQTKAAKRLEINRSTLWRMLKKSEE